MTEDLYVVNVCAATVALAVLTVFLACVFRMLMTPPLGSASSKSRVTGEVAVMK